MTLALGVIQIAPAVVGGVARLRAVTRDWDGSPIDIDGQLGHFSVYDITKQPVMTNAPSIRQSLAEYYFDWSVPSNLVPGWFFVEFSYSVAGEADLARSQFQVVFG